MQKEKIKAFLIDANNDTATTITIEDTSDKLSNSLGCDVIDIVEYQVGGQTYDFIVDDEGVYSGKRPTVFDSNQSPIILNSVIICRSKLKDDTCIEDSLTDEDITNIQQHLGYLRLKNTVAPAIMIDNNFNIK